MITLVDLIQMLAAIFGLMLGLVFGHDSFGVVGAIVGAIVGFLIGAYLGHWPRRLEIQRERKKFAVMTVEQLIQGLYDPKCWTPNFFLMELKSRGEDIQKHYNLVLSMMESDTSPLKRQFGYAALLSAFPDQAQKLKGYSPASSPDDCKAKVSMLRLEG